MHFLKIINMIYGSIKIVTIESSYPEFDKKWVVTLKNLNAPDATYTLLLISNLNYL